VWRYHFVIMTASVWVWERAATMDVGAGLPAIKTLRFVSDSPVRPTADEPASRGGAGSNDVRGSWLASD
jgi:hypothetical protein